MTSLRKTNGMLLMSGTGAFDNRNSSDRIEKKVNDFEPDLPFMYFVHDNVVVIQGHIWKDEK